MAMEYDWSKEELPHRPYMAIDNFIRPSIIRNTIGDVYFISEDSQTEMNELSLTKHVNDSCSDYNRSDSRNDGLAELQLENLISYNKKILRFESIEEYQAWKEEFLNNIHGKDVILDIDLDYFNDGSSYNSNPEIRSRTQIINNFKFLRDLTQWNLITVALSPEYCGGEDSCRYLFELFLECFDIVEKELIDW